MLLGSNIFRYANPINVLMVDARHLASRSCRIWNNNNRRTCTAGISRLWGGAAIGVVLADALSVARVGIALGIAGCGPCEPISTHWAEGLVATVAHCRNMQTQHRTISPRVRMRSVHMGAPKVVVFISSLGLVSRLDVSLAPLLLV